MRFNLIFVAVFAAVTLAAPVVDVEDKSAPKSDELSTLDNLKIVGGLCVSAIKCAIKKKVKGA